MSVYYSDDTVALLHGDAAEQAATLAPQSVQAVVTSPPYFGLRDYGVEGQLGAESSPAEFVANLVAVFEAIRPALSDNGVLWVNLGDSYSTYPGNRGPSTGISKGRDPYQNAPQGAGLSGDRPAKNLLMIPARFAIAMQDAGWILRNDIIWAKPNGMPESVRDRFSTKHEHVFLFAKSPRYYFDLDAVRVPTVTIRPEALTWARDSKEADVPGQSTRQHRASRTLNQNQTPRHASATDNTGWKNHVIEAAEAGRNPGDVWEIPTRPFTGAHFAVFPPEIPERCILASTREGDTVLDPFSGSGTTGMVATKHGRQYIGIDLNADYHELALKTRLAQGVLA